MKRKMMALIMSFLLFGCTKPEEAPGTGGWAAVNDGTITDEYRELFSKATDEYEPIELLETQIVAGMNYKFLCVDKDGAKVIVRIYEDLEGNVEVTSVTPSSNTTIANPFVQVDRIEQAEDGAGFTMEEPDMPDGFVDIRTSYIENDLIQIIYEYENDEIYIRKAKEEGDISGDYNSYEKTETIMIEDLEVTVKSDDEGVRVLTWQNGEYAYSITSEKGLSLETATEMVKQLK